MMPQQHELDRQELHRLLDQHCSGRLAPRDARRLCAALRGEADARRLFLEYMDLHSSLAWQSSAQLEDELAAPALARGPGWRGWFAGWRGKAAQLLRTRQGVSLTAATAILVLVLCALAFTPVPQYVWRGALSPPQLPAAHLTGDVDCRWGENSPALDVGATLYEGQTLELASGTAEITFLRGAVATIRGPARLAIDSAAQGSLRRGKLAARLPDHAAGFVLMTPAAKVTDLGTEFGVEVGQDGAEEVHVFEGRVDVALHASPLPPLRLAQSEALRIPPGLKTQPQRLAAARQEQFPRTIERSGATTAAPPLPPEQHPPVTRGLALWLAADGAVRCGREDRVLAWLDMPAGDNHKPHHAMQPIADRQPRWVASAVGGKPAIRFDGDDLLILPTPSDIGLFNRPYEMFIVARTSSPAIQFLIGGDMEEMELHLNGQAGARFIPAGFEAGRGGSDLGANLEFSDGRPHLFSARIDAGARRGLAAVDGRESSDATAGDARSVSAGPLRLGMRYDGSHGLVGEIAEVLVYSNALDDAERAEIYKYIRRKYGIAAAH